VRRRLALLGKFKGKPGPGRGKKGKTAAASDAAVFTAKEAKGRHHYFRKVGTTALAVLVIKLVS
jgi:hypothetical protein